MLGCEFVRDGHGVGEFFDEDEHAIQLQHRREMRLPRKLRELRGDLFFHARQQRRGVGDEKDRAAFAVLGLREQIARDPRGVRAGIGEDQNFARSRQQVDRDLPEDLPLGLHDIRISWPENLLHRRDRGRAISQRRDRLRAADLIDLRGPAVREREKQRVIILPIAIGRRRHHDFRHTRRRRQRHRHDRC